MVRSDTSSLLIITVIVSVSYWCWIVLEVWLVARERGTARNSAVRALADRFGKDYEEYRRRTWALVPFVW